MALLAIFIIGSNKQPEKTFLEILEARKYQAPIDASFEPASLGWIKATSSANWEDRDSHATVVYKDKIWVMGGVNANGHVISENPGNVDYGDSKYFADVWSSPDGTNWQLATNNAAWGERRSVETVDFKGKMWLMGGWGPKVGYKNDIWSSTDGINWKQEAVSSAWPAREGHQLVVFQGKMWLIGGVNYGTHHILPWLFGGFTVGHNTLYNDVWSSEDGIHWTQSTNNASWSPRWDFASEVFNEKIWVIDGMDYYGQDGHLFHDIWSSVDGKNWKLENANPPFATRQGNAALNYQNKLWVVSRLNSAEYGNGANDVWYSSNGISWQKTKQDSEWLGREDLGIVIFKDKMWALGGMDKNYHWNNDVWHSVSNLDK